MIVPRLDSDFPRKSKVGINTESTSDEQTER